MRKFIMGLMLLFVLVALGTPASAFSNVSGPVTSLAYGVGNFIFVEINNNIYYATSSGAAKFGPPLYAEYLHDGTMSFFADDYGSIYVMHISVGNL